ncbi:MAG: hypothetical protein MUP62_03290 [Dehalococcoidia bacterium]|jgi:hypothetical protein|nr:hypothetical protein [Dehalococcoidia bacterium]
MDLMLLRNFQRQVLLQCEFILLAAADINETLKMGQEGKDTINRVFYAIQNLLVAAANVSKALWGLSGAQSAQRQALRASIGISDASPLREVDMRNHFEHFDERLERWWSDSSRHNIADLCIGPPEMIKGLDDSEMFRFFDPRTTEIVFWGQRFNLQELVDEVSRIIPALRTEAAKPHWEP